jgi:hypothetical protein
MCAQITGPAEAYSPDADRDGPAVSAHTPDWLVYLLARLIFFLLHHLRGNHMRRFFAHECHDRPDLPAGSAQAEAASIRGQFGNAIAWMCRRHGVGPEHPDWPYLSRSIVAFGGSVAGFRPGLPACGLQWWDNPLIVPGMAPGFGLPAAPAASLLQQAVANAPPLPPPAPSAMPVEAAHAHLPASCQPASGWRIFARAGPAPPSGRTLPETAYSAMLHERGQSMAGPAVLIRAA